MNQQQPATIKVLLVDDEPSIRVALAFLIKQLGYQVMEATNGEEALELLAQHQPNVVILDVMMPRLDGFEVARRIRTQPLYAEVKIVFLTARGTEEDRFDGYGSGGELYITKPFDNAELVNTIRELVEYG